jgi:hypothetical protein
MNRGELDGHRILKTSTYDVMWKRATPPDAKANVGISWFLSEADGEQRVSHNGGDDGFLSALVMVPARKAAFICMTNCDFMKRDLLVRMIDAALQTPK